MINLGTFHLQETKNITAELLDTSEPLIHDTYGCGSQGLINLMITGQAVPHVWDHDKDVGGLSKTFSLSDNLFLFILKYAIIS